MEWGPAQAREERVWRSGRVVPSSHRMDKALGWGCTDVPWSPSSSSNEPGDPGLVGASGLSYYSCKISAKNSEKKLGR